MVSITAAEARYHFLGISFQRMSHHCSLYSYSSKYHKPLRLEMDVQLCEDL